GEAIAVIAAENKHVLHEAKRKIKFEYEELTPILDIATAVQKKAFIGLARTIQCGDVEKALRDSPHRLKGSVEMAGQDHFYLESQACVAYPKEGDQIEVHSS